MKDFTTDSLVLGIVGAGIMGRGIAQIAATAGIRVIMTDVNERALTEAVDFVHRMIDRVVEKGRMTAGASASAKRGISTTSATSGLAGADMVIEAVVEDLEVKRALFRELESIVTPECVLGTNTSSLPVTAVAAACRHQQRVVGCHFFNPVPLMKLVEVIGGARTDSGVADQVEGLVRRLGHTPVRVCDSPGFLVNHLGRGLNTEGLRVLSEKIADTNVIDAVMRECVGLRMGPFELMDLTALDVTCPVSELVYEQYYQEPRLRPTPTLRLRYTAGLLGRKVGEGFYRYQDGEKVLPDEPAVPALAAPGRFWVSRTVEEYAAAIEALLAEAGAERDTGERPGPDSICLVTPMGLDTTTAAIDEDLDPVRTVSVDLLFPPEKRICLMTSPATDAGVADCCHATFAAAGRMVSVIRDSAGFIAQRMAANIINTACDIAQQGIAAPGDIDTAARLGLGYPRGPLALGDDLGPALVLEILENLQAVYGDPRYRPSPWLRRRAMLGLSLLHAER